MDCATDHVSETRLLESRLIPANRLLRCTQSETLVGSHEIIELSKLDQVELDQVVPDLNKKNQKGKKRGGAAKKKGFQILLGWGKNLGPLSTFEERLYLWKVFLWV